MLHSQRTNNYLGIQAVHSNPSPKHNGTTQRNTARSFHCTRRGKACIARYRLVKEHKHADNKVQTYPGILKNNVRITAVFRTPAPWTPKLRSTLMQIGKATKTSADQLPSLRNHTAHCTSNPDRHAHEALWQTPRYKKKNVAHHHTAVVDSLAIRAKEMTDQLGGWCFIAIWKKQRCLDLPNFVSVRTILTPRQKHPWFQKNAMRLLRQEQQIFLPALALRSQNLRACTLSRNSLRITSIMRNPRTTSQALHNRTVIYINGVQALLSAD